METGVAFADRVTGKKRGGRGARPHPCGYQAEVRLLSIVSRACSGVGVGASRNGAGVTQDCEKHQAFGSMDRSVVGVIKRSTVSTAHLKVFQPLQLRPINLVVYQGSLGRRGDHATLILRGASRLDAFSGYPCHT